jgi:3-oxoacyl-[acyl-carrier protein] reductase
MVETMNKKTVLIIGATKGIGKEIADYLKPVYNLIVCGRTAPIIIEPNFISIPCDITKPNEVKNLLHHTLITFKKIDVVINSSGVVLLKPFLDYTEDDIDLILNTNIKGACVISQEIIPIFKQQKRGRIIHLGSTRSFTVAPDKSIYAMSKFALRALNMSINLEFNKYKIYSSMVCPGRVDITGLNPMLVSPQDIIVAIDKILSLPNNMNIQEIILGGQL